MELRLPPEKLSRLKNLIREWRQRKACTLHDLQSLIGHLCHAAKVAHPGRRFLGEMFNLLPHGKKKWHRLRLTAGFRADLEWWHTFLSDWNDVSMMSQPDLHSPDIQIFSDASGSLGCAAIWNNQWFQFAWDSAQEFTSAPIAAKELLPILVATAVWGKEWSGKTVKFRCDNQAVVSILQSGACKEPNMADCYTVSSFVTPSITSHSRLSSARLPQCCS